MAGVGAVWQHKGFSNQWHNFPDNVSTMVDRAFQAGAPYAKYSVRGSPYTIDFNDFRQYCEVDCSKVRTVRRLPDEDFSTSSSSRDVSGSVRSTGAGSSRSCAGNEAAAIWQYEMSAGSEQWRDFPTELSMIVEESFTKGCALKRYRLGRDEYELDFRAMKQRSMRDSRRARAVKRVGGPGGPAIVPEPISAAWHRFATLAEDVSSEEKVLKLFAQRQQGNASLTVAKCTRVENSRLLKFQPEAGKHPTIIFHGTPEANVGNIIAEGLLMEFCGGCGGIFGAMNPGTSLGYAQKAGGARHFMLVCIYDLAAPPQPGAAYSVPKDTAATVLWLLKLA